MTTRNDAEADLAARIEAAPAGGAVTAFVVVDGGLLAGCPLGPAAAPDTLWGRFVADVRSGVGGPGDVSVAEVERVVRSRCGRDAEEVAEEGRATFRATTASW